MQSRCISRVPIAVMCALCLCTSACQQYQPSPLYPEGHRRAWHARTPDDATVRAFVERLAHASEEQTLDFDPSDGIDIDESILIATLYNPDLRLERLRAGVALADADNAGLWSDPALGVDALYITESVPDRWIISPSLAITIPISGRTHIEKDHANAIAQAHIDRVVESEWRIQHKIREAWIGRASLRVTSRELLILIERLESLVVATRTLAENGEMTPTEAGLFTLELDLRQTELSRTMGRLSENEHQLRALMGLSPSAPITLDDIPSFAPHAREGGSLGTQFSNPTLDRLEREYEVAEHTLHLEIARQVPDLVLAPIYESEQGQSRIGLMGALPIPILNANKQAIANARVARELARAAFETEYERIAGEHAQLQARAQALTLEQEQIETSTVPLVDNQVARATSLLELGEGNALVLLQSIVRAHATKLQLVAVHRDQSLAYLRMKYLLGPTASIPSHLPESTTSEVTQ